MGQFLLCLLLGSDVAGDALHGDGAARLVVDHEVAVLRPDHLPATADPAQDQGLLWRNVQTQGSLEEGMVIRMNEPVGEIPIFVKLFGRVAKKAGHGGRDI
jgi:hypothetical protein